MTAKLSITTRQHSQMVDITAEVQRVVSAGGITDGTVVIFCPHTTAGLTINEHADPDVAADLLESLDRLAPWQAHYRHTEGNAAAHIKSALLGHSLTVLVEGGRLALGTWQGLLLCEFDGPRQRRVMVKVVPDP